MTKPIDPVAGKSARWTATTPDEVKAVVEYAKTLPTWVEKDAKVQHIIANTLPNSLFICLANKKSMYKYFDTLSALFEQHSIVVGAELR